ncbi:MAG TPA: hypothetical protein VMV72_15140 [Verrucomicrobiae bacterium]|nr:hypothetical protein [Verrucomicrobiae bacterium]
MNRLIVAGVLVATSLWARPVAEELPTDGAPISLAGWSYRRKVEIKNDGVQRLDLDLETLARATDDLRDLRVVRERQQYPYVVERPAEPHSYVPIVDTVADAKRPTMGVWKIHLPAEGAPVTRLLCQTRAPWFDRQVTLSEATDDGRRFLGSAHWSRTPNEPAKPLVLPLSGRPATAVLTLEMDNGDNPGIALEDFQCEFAAVQLLFVGSTTADTFLYYGNSEAGPPSYDVGLVAPQLRAATQTDASLDGEERLLRPAGQMTSPYAWLFWVVLVVVAAVLLLVIVRMVPKAPPSV